MIKKIINEKVLMWAVILLIALQPLIDMDYLIYDFLDQFGLPRLSTIIRFIIIPLLILGTFYLKDQNKKKTVVFGGLYAICLAVYYYFHCQQAVAIYPDLSLTTNFQFNWFQELTYILTLVLPYGVVYCIYNLHFSEKIIKNITYFMSSIIAIPIFLGDVFVFGKSTYYGYTIASFISWFTGIYENNHPRELASKFFFDEGNTIGILMFALLPLLYYFFSKATSKKEKIGVGALILVHSLSMQILGTRVATYGALLLPACFLVLYLFDCFILKNQKIKINVVALAGACTIIFAMILPYTPAIQNQQVDAVNDLALLDNGMADEGREAFTQETELIPGTAEFNQYYIFMFEQYGIKAKYAQSIPTMYYIDWYNYKFDPYFWCDMILNHEVEERVGGRQIQKIFMNYKYENITQGQKFLGMGYSTFMNGSILLEQDFVQQVYTLGYVGELLCCVPWVLTTLAGAILVLVKWQKLLKLDVMVYAMSVVAMLGAAYTSGHTLDQFVTTIFLAMLVAILLNRIHDAYQKDNK
ncbi:MAG: O-antigen ligase family protein [Erysipelotrichaceae bacterium]|nr:O-antigen ligase family protein [Erysipelotrichaceae bacterium]MDY5252419.1 O-antigen ligase family protein [Erysipelotrichaceae bacterium]